MEPMEFWTFFTVMGDLFATGWDFLVNWPKEKEEYIDPSISVAVDNFLTELGKDERKKKEKPKPAPSTWQPPDPDEWKRAAGRS